MKNLMKSVSIFVFTFIIFINNLPLLSAECECGKNGTAFSKYENGILYDIYNTPVSFDKLPARVISLVPAITEMIEAVNPDFRLSGITTHDSEKIIAAKAKTVGGFYKPDIKVIKDIKPEIIFAASLHKAIFEEFTKSNTYVIVLDAHNADELYSNIEIFGRLFRGEKNAKYVINGIKAKIDNIQKKLAAVPADKRLRVMRLMGFDNNILGTPGDDSFQTEAIRLAGGIPIKTGRSGQITYINNKEWYKFNPQAVYSCGDSKMWDKLKVSKSWNNTDAVKNNRHFVFPCEYTCRASVNYGKFIESLSAALYGDYFFTNPPVKKDSSAYEKKVQIDVHYIKSASIKYGTIDDFEQKTLVLNLSKKMSVLSTLTGMETADTVGNHYLSPPRWNDSHAVTVDALEKKICNAVNADSASSAFLMTGADMDNIAIVKKEYRKLVVYALVTAGVTGNAQRQSQDEGLYYNHGTINMILLSNASLSQGATARAIISATEAKTAALQDLDIRSNYTGLTNQATGTGTDNIIVISGEGSPENSAGGHTKLGELIARAAYEGTTKAILMQNGIRSARSVYRRLEERGISIARIASFAGPEVNVQEAAIRVERALLDAEIAGFIESAFAMEDAGARKLVSDYSLFNKWCLETAEKIAEKKIQKLVPVNIAEKTDSPLNMALSAVLTGAINK